MNFHIYASTGEVFELQDLPNGMSAKMDLLSKFRVALVVMEDGTHLKLYTGESDNPNGWRIVILKEGLQFDRLEKIAAHGKFPGYDVVYMKDGKTFQLVDTSKPTGRT